MRQLTLFYWKPAFYTQLLSNCLDYLIKKWARNILLFKMNFPVCTVEKKNFSRIQELRTNPSIELKSFEQALSSAKKDIQRTSAGKLGLLDFNQGNTNSAILVLFFSPSLPCNYIF